MAVAPGGEPCHGGAMEQLRFLRAELARNVNGRWWRWITLPFAQSTWALASYRLQRAAHLRFGRTWPVLRVACSPLVFALERLGGVEIHYRADIGPGLHVLHPSLGIVVSAYTKAGTGLVLTGGNCIGGTNGIEDTAGVVLGDGVLLGANAVILGPVTVGDRALLAAGAVLVDDAPGGMMLAGVPAKPVKQRALTAAEGTAEMD